MSKPTTHREVINLWPSKAEFGRAIGVNEANARKMHANGIPPKHYAATAKALVDCGFPALTYAELSEMDR